MPLCVLRFAAQCSNLAGFGGSAFGLERALRQAATSMARPLTVLQLLPALDAGGVERGTVEISKALTDAGHRSLVCSAGGRMVAALEATGGQHFTRPIGAKRPWVLRQVAPLAKLITAENVDLVHARSRLPAWIGWRALQRVARQTGARPPFVTTLHGVNSVSRYSAIMTRGDHVIAVSQSCLEYWAQHYPEFDASAATVIHRGIDPLEFPYAYEPDVAWQQQWQADFSIPQDRALITLPGRLTAWKGQPAFIRLIAALNKHGLPVHGLIVGGAEKSKRNYAQGLRDLAEQCGVTELITFTGHRRDMREIYAISDLVLSMSERPEAFGRVVPEALALGTPVIGWDHGGVGESLGAIYSIGKVPLGDEQALTNRTMELLRRPQPVPDEQPFLRSKMQAQTLTLYQNAAGKRSL